MIYDSTWIFEPRLVMQWVRTSRGSLGFFLMEISGGVDARA